VRDYSDISNEVMAKYACSHAKTERRNKPDRNGRPMVVTQCLRCGERVGPFIPVKTLSAAEIAALPLFDHVMEREYDSAKFSEINTLWDAEKKKADAAWWARYETHLKSPKWKAISRKVILRAQGMCEGCRSRPATQAHHLTYERMGDEMLFDLVAVCDACHKKIHPEEEEPEDTCPF
jgi:5-methylcytosine-specific restriction endonuclease McrA